MSTRALCAVVAVWLLLALGTLVLVIRDGDALRAALVAWAGGIFTLVIAQEALRRLRVGDRHI